MFPLLLPSWTFLSSRIRPSTNPSVSKAASGQWECSWWQRERLTNFVSRWWRTRAPHPIRSKCSECCAGKNMLNSFWAKRFPEITYRLMILDVFYLWLTDWLWFLNNKNALLTFDKISPKSHLYKTPNLEVSRVFPVEIFWWHQHEKIFELYLNVSFSCHSSINFTLLFSNVFFFSGQLKEKQKNMLLISCIF